MGFDGMVTGAVTRQLSQLLVGGKIEKIYQPESDEIIMNIHSGRENYKLYLSSNSSHARMHLISSAGSNPQNPSGFCMLLRKHLQGGRISSILQKDTERIVEMSVDTINELGFSVNKKLIIEIMGKHSNIIVIDAVTGKIIDSIKRISIDVNRYRQILPGQIYVYPPSQEKVPYHEITEQHLISMAEFAQDRLSRALVDRIQGISPVIAEEIVFQAGLLSDSSHTENPDAASLLTVIKNFSQKIHNGDFSPKVYLDDNGVPVDFHLFPLAAFKGIYEELSFDHISEAADYFYSNKSSSNRIKQKSSDLERAIHNSLDKLYLKKQRLSEDLLKAANAETDRLYGELLTANLHLIRQGDGAAEVLNYYDNQIVQITLDPRFSPSQNAQRYYKKYSKAKTAITEKNIQLREANQDIEYLESVLSYIEKAVTVDEIEELRQELIEGGYLRKRKNQYKPSRSKPSPYQYTSSDGHKILVGRNNKENDILTFKTASGKDVWFHTKDIPGSHVILFTEGKGVTETAIFEAAAIAAYHSKARESENVPVDYTQVRHVKKPSGAKPGMVIFVDNKTVYVNPSVT
ncbi:Rqc2 family fibronectin-binding protein [Sinanaerobacter chloroacetimidivorans]|uniref:Rqc2 homolog RqcH n=1 Tax=Sinanaerobacter chloroacetimidivorans TaxID=2818044 RepID=A0A8J8B209_9FIRM|nr:NFACT RNA binding domain-containing protein [Sinanaerobacter chloroacetimidivorans]MBR0596785.1 NFACT family protein [Sinanaerobacter chloroacetimidivorans]